MGATAGLSSSAPENTATKLAVAPEYVTEFTQLGAKLDLENLCRESGNRRHRAAFPGKHSDTDQASTL